MHDVRLTRETAYALVGLACKVERLGDEVYLLAVARRQIVTKQFLERIINQLIISDFLSVLLFVHS